MPKSDQRPKPGDMVLLRGNVARDVWAEPPKQRAGVVMPGSLGLVISANHETAKFYTYVLWSMPCIMGWIEDGFLLKA